MAERLPMLKWTECYGDDADFVAVAHVCDASGETLLTLWARRKFRWEITASADRVLRSGRSANRTATRVDAEDAASAMLAHARAQLIGGRDD